MEDLTRSVASIGEEATAVVKMEENSRSKRIVLRGTPFSVEVSLDSIGNFFERSREAIVDAYRNLRRQQS